MGQRYTTKGKASARPKKAPFRGQNEAVEIGRSFAPPLTGGAKPEIQLVLLGMAGRPGTARKGLLHFRTGLGHLGMAAEAGVGHMSPAEDFAVMHNLEIAALRLLILGIMAAISIFLIDFLYKKRGE